MSTEWGRARGQGGSPGLLEVGRRTALRWGLLILVLSAGLTPERSQAGGISLGWQDCRSSGAPGQLNQNFSCTTNIVEFPLFAGLRLESAVDSVIAVELVIDVDVAADPLPPWWRMDPGQCHTGGWAADASLSGSCADPWQGTGAASAQGWRAGEPGGSPRHGRLLVAAATAPGQLLTFDAETGYTLCRILLRSNNTLTCDGCSVAACLVFNSVLIRRLPGSVPEELVFSAPEAAAAERVSWQGGTGANCASVPVRRSTWSAVKALYR